MTHKDSQARALPAPVHHSKHPAIQRGGNLYTVCLPEPSKPFARPISSEYGLMAPFQCLLRVLQQHDITRTTVTFSGNDFVAEQQEVAYHGAGDIDGSVIELEMITVDRGLEDKRRAAMIERMNLDSALATFTIDYLEEVKITRDHGFAGYGDLVLDVDDPALEVAVYPDGDGYDERYYRYHSFGADMEA